MRYASLVGLFCVCCCCAVSYAAEESVLVKDEPTTAVAAEVEATPAADTEVVCEGGVCRLFPRRTVTRTRTVTTADACGNCEAREYSRTRYRGRVFPRRVVSYSGCSCN